MSYQRKGYHSHGRGNSTFTLNITSMTDMFTIMLVFLLQTYASNELAIIPEKNIDLPSSSSELNPSKSLKMTLSRTELKLEDEIILSLENGLFSSKDIDQNDRKFLPTLSEKLNKLNQEPEGKILLQADSSLSYDTLKKVMYTATMSGFPKLKMATIMGN